MLRSKPIAITIAIMCSLFGMISGSNAFEIVEFPSDTEDYSYGGITYHTASLKTDVPFYSVWWYVDGTFVSSTYGGHEKTEASFSPHWLTGGIKGVKYTIKAEAMWIEDDGTTQNDTDSYVLRVFEPRTDWRQETRSSVWCYSEISRHYYRPQRQDVRADYYAYAWNPLDKDEVGVRFADRIYMLEYYLDVFGFGVSDFARKTYNPEPLPPRSYAGFKSHTLTVSVQFGTEGHDYVSKASVAHGLNGNAPRDPNFLVRIGIENEIEFRRK